MSPRVYDTLANLFERVHFFLQRLKCYADIPLTIEMTELLGKVMAQVLHILACSTKTMKEGRISESIRLAYAFVIDVWCRNVFEKAIRKDGHRSCASTSGHSHESRGIDDSGEKLRGDPPCR